MSFRGFVKKLIPSGLFRRIEPFGHLAEAALMQVIYGFPARKLKIIGVTGTNGKTSTSFMIHRMMNEAGFKVGLMSTVGWGVGDKITPQIEHMTTMPTRQLLGRLKALKNSGAEWVVLEVTSHALGQNRVWGIPYQMAVMTNVTHEHLDYHGTFENYRAAKLKLFELTAKNRGGLGVGIVNADDPSAEMFASSVPRVLTYGVKKGEMRAKNIKSTPSGSRFTAEVEDIKLNLKVNLPGSFNVYNAMAAAGAGLALKMSPEQIEQGIAALPGVEGRMNVIKQGQPFEVIIDYAHTPDSFEIMFRDLKPMVKGKLIVMFGSAGRRDVAKRAILGEIAGKHADVVIATEEDDRDVDGMLILGQIAGGAEKAGKVRDNDLFLVHNREEAIKFAIGKAKAGDTVLLLGKGHEKNIERAHGLDDWDEVDIAQKALKLRNS